MLLCTRSRCNTFLISDARQQELATITVAFTDGTAASNRPLISLVHAGASLTDSMWTVLACGFHPRRHATLSC